VSTGGATSRGQHVERQRNPFRIGNTDQEKIGLLCAGDHPVAINWPENMTEKSGRHVTATASSIHKAE
jgi:hypothetical protein